MRSSQVQCRDCIASFDAGPARTWVLNKPAQMRARLVLDVSSSVLTHVLVTSLAEDVASVAELAAQSHGRWLSYQGAFKCLRHRLSLARVSP